MQTAEMTLEQLEELLKERPDDPELNYQHGLLLAERGESGRACRSWRKVLEQVPSHRKALNLL